MYSVTTAAVTREQITMAEKTNRGTRKANLTKGTGALRRYIAEQDRDGVKTQLDRLKVLFTIFEQAHDTYQATKDKFMAASCLDVKGYSFRVRSADRTQFVVRVHWAAGRVPHEAIDTALGQYGTVMTSANEQSTVVGFEGVATGIRSVVMSGNRDQIPRLLQVADPVTAENYKLLCVITGRKPQRKHTGHYRRDCTTPYCRHHDVYGHDSEGCSAAKSYAAATRRDLRKQVDTSEYDTAEEDIPCAQVSLTSSIIKPSSKMPRFAYKKAKSGLLEPVMVKGGPPLPLSWRRRWSRCLNPVRTTSLPTGSMNLPAGRWSGGEVSGSGRDRRWCQSHRSFLIINYNNHSLRL